MRLFLISVCLIVSIGPTAEAATSCSLDLATLRPKDATNDFVLRPVKHGRDPLFELAIRATGQTFRFRVDRDLAKHEGRLISVSGPDGADPGLAASFVLPANTLRTQDAPIGSLSFIDLAKSFIAYRTRTGQPRNIDAFPPSGLWEVTECANVAAAEPER